MGTSLRRLLCPSAISLSSRSAFERLNGGQKDAKELDIIKIFECLVGSLL